MWCSVLPLEYTAVHAILDQDPIARTNVCGVTCLTEFTEKLREIEMCQCAVVVSSAPVSAAFGSQTSLLLCLLIRRPKR